MEEWNLVGQSPVYLFGELEILPDHFILICGYTSAQDSVTTAGIIQFFKFSSLDEDAQPKIGVHMRQQGLIKSTGFFNNAAVNKNRIDRTGIPLDKVCQLIGF